MARDSAPARPRVALILEVCCWPLSILQWLFRSSSVGSKRTPRDRTPDDLLTETLHRSKQYEEWHAAAQQMDRMLGNEQWRETDVGLYYNAILVTQRMQRLEDIMDRGDILDLHDTLRSGLSRSTGGILHPKLYSQANGGTKLLIDEYIGTVVEAIKAFTEWPTTQLDDEGLTPQTKLDCLHDTRLSFGRTALVLQGGSLFGLCHLGVMKALHLRGLLPRIIAGTGTGALMAALVCVHREEELLDFLSGNGIDISHFAASSQQAAHSYSTSGLKGRVLWLITLQRRAIRLITSGFILNPAVLGRSVHSNLGDITFEQAYEKTKRILNITISPSGPGSITLLNYLTAPHVLIWTAAMVSNSTDPYESPTQLLCKDENNKIVPYLNGARPRTDGKLPKWTYYKQESPLKRLAELFNVNQYLVSQARPYLTTFAAPSAVRTRDLPLKALILRFAYNEMMLRLKQLDNFSLLPASAKRFLQDEILPGPSVTFVPQMDVWDWTRILRNPTKAEIERWIERGEKSVWPKVAELTVRLAVEIELDRGYQLVRSDPLRKIRASEGQRLARERSIARARKRRKRAASMGEAQLGL